MKLEVGKYYRTRDGRKVGPAKNFCGVSNGRMEFEGDWEYAHERDGKYIGDDEGLDIVAIWEDSPVREVTRREIVPGTYGRVIVGKTYEAGIWFEIADDEKGSLILTAEELDNVAMIASQLAEALRDG